MQLETTQQYIDRYWRKVYGKTTMRDRIVEAQLQVDQHEFELSRMKQNLQKFRTSVSEVSEICLEISKQLREL